MRVKFKTIPDIYSMKRSLPSAILLVILCLLASCGVHQKFRQAEFSRDVESAIDSVCQHYMDKGHFPGMAVAVVTQDRKLWSKGYGYSDIDSKRPIDPKRDRFRIGSISKSVTASALARLVEDPPLLSGLSGRQSRPHAASARRSSRLHTALQRI
jgi:hypothetical protein